MRGTGQISGDWSLDDIKTAMAEALAADRAARAELQAEQKAYTRANVPLPGDLPTRK